MRPILKQSWETTMVCSVAPSGSEPARSAATAFSALSVEVEEALSGNGVPLEGDPVEETSSDATVCKGTSSVWMGSFSDGVDKALEVDFFFFPSDLRTNFDITYSYRRFLRCNI